MMDTLSADKAADEEAAALRFTSCSFSSVLFTTVFRERELSLVVVRAEDVALIEDQLEVSKNVADRTLREHKVNSQHALTLMTTQRNPFLGRRCGSAAAYGPCISVNKNSKSVRHQSRTHRTLESYVCTCGRFYSSSTATADLRKFCQTYQKRQKNHH